jgi:hypothetical protein
MWGWAQGEPKQQQSMEDKQWTVQEWKDNTAKNSTNAYSLAVNFAALCIKEFGQEEGLKQVRGLSGAQAEFAVVLSKKIPDFV